MEKNIPWLNTKEINFQSYLLLTETVKITKEGFQHSSVQWVDKN